MTAEEAIKLFEKVHLLGEQLDMQKDIDEICYILSQNSINMYQVREKIDVINNKHPENIVLFNIIFPPQGNSVPLDAASHEDLIYDLRWKQRYLQAKRYGKVFNELCKEMKNKFG